MMGKGSGVPSITDVQIRAGGEQALGDEGAHPVHQVPGEAAVELGVREHAGDGDAGVGVLARVQAPGGAEEVGDFGWRAGVADGQLAALILQP